MYRVEEYSCERDKEWDEFVLEKSVNGTFLQTRNFLNYHPKERFQDASLMVYDKGRLIAVCPACEIEECGHRTLFSHKGSTFGGIIIKTDYYVAEKVLQIIDVLETYFANKYTKVTLKITADLFSKRSSDLLEYALRYKGFENYIELSTYVDLKELDDNVLVGFDRNKCRNIIKCEEQGLIFRELQTDKEVEGFHQLLTINLEKYGVKPIHTVQEILEFKNERLCDNTKFYGVFQGERLLAAGMLFTFGAVKTIHAQNLSADYRFTEFSPITYLYYKVIEQAKRDGFDFLSWGISTEEKGTILNFGLIRNKESYGSKHQVNRTFYKSYEA